MANIKNFGIVGVGAGVQFGKGGAQIVQTSGTFAAMNATGNAFVRFQVADGASGNDVASFQQLTNAVTVLNSNAAAIQTELDATQTGAGLNTDGSYAVPVGTFYLNNSASLANATILLDAALGAEVVRAEAAESALTNAIANVSTSTSGLQAEVDQIETSVGLGTDGTLTLAAGNYLGSAPDLVSAVEILDGVLGNTNVALASNAGLIAGIVANVATLSSEVANVQTDVSNLSDQLLLDESNIATIQSTVSDLGNAVVSNAAILSETVANVATLQLNQTADEANIAALQSSIGSESANIVALQSNVATLQLNQTADEANIAALQVSVAADEASISDLQGNVATLQGDVVTLTADVAQNTSDISNNAAELGSLEGEVSGIQDSYVNKDGSVTMTGALNMGNNVISFVSDPVANTDAATKNYVDTKIGLLAGAFEYKGTVTPGADSGNAVTLPSGQDAGAYYKAINDGYLVGAEANSVAFFVHQNDGVVHNTNTDGAEGTWDVIAHVDSQVFGTINQIDVVGTVDTGFTVSIDGAYTVARQTELADNIAAVTSTLEGELAANVAVLQGKVDAANAAIAVVNTAVTTETARAETAEITLANSITLTNANVSTVANSVAAETTRAEAAEAALANAASNAVVVETARAEQAESDLANAIASTNSNVTVVANSVSTETTRAEAAEATLSNAVVAETARAEAAEAALANAASNAVVVETARAEAAEAALSNAVTLVNANVATLDATVVQNTSDISNTSTLLNFVQYSAGLQNDGSYAANATGHYVANALSLHDADDLLDTAVFNLSQQLADLSQDTIKTSDSLNSVHVADDAVTTKLNVGNVATTVMTVVATANTNTQLAVDFSTANSVSLLASGSASDVDLRLAGQGSGHVIIGETGVGVIQSDSGFDMTVAAGAGANLNLLGDTVIIGEADGTPVAMFAGTAGATGYLTGANGNTAVSLGAAGTASNIDLVFAPKGTGSVNVSSAKVINVANATNSSDAVNLGQVQSLVSAAQTGIVTTVVGVLPATSGSVTLGTITGTVLSVRVLISNTYDGGSTITVGTSMTANDLASSTDIDESNPGVYAIDTVKDYTSTTITATVTNATGLNGAAKVVVEYLEA